MTPAAHGADGALATADPLRPPLPTCAQIEPIGRCNLACRMCTVNHRVDDGQLSLREFTRLLDQLPGLRSLHLQGLGEPLMHPQFFEMVEHAVARGIAVSSNTNATLITQRRAERCVTSGLAELSLSLDGARAATYEAVRQGARWAKVLRNVRRLVQAKRERGSATPQLRLVLVLMRSNLAELPDLVGLAADLGVPTILVQRLSNQLTEPELPTRYIPIRDYVQSAELTRGDLGAAAGIFAAARARAAELGITLHLPKLGVGAPRVSVQPAAPATASERGPACSWPFTETYITAKGDLLPCCMVATADRLNFGNALAEGLAAAWNSEAAQRLRRELLDRQPNAVCRGCALYKGQF